MFQVKNVSWWINSGLLRLNLRSSQEKEAARTGRRASDAGTPLWQNLFRFGELRSNVKG